MGTVIPYDVDSWWLMHSMKHNVNYYRTEDPKRFDLAIKKSEQVFTDELSKYVSRSVA